MKLYVVRASHNCRRVLATAAHLGLGPEVVEVDLQSGAHKKPEYLAVNPNGKVPTLVDGDLKLWESNAIMQYLASQKANDSFFPSDPKQRAEITRWQFWEANHLSRGTNPLGFEKVFKPMFMKQEPDAAAVEGALKIFHTFAPVLNAQLEGKKFICGDNLTLADFSVGADFTYAKAGGFPLSDYPHISAWLDRLDQNQAWKQSAPG